MGIDVGRVQEKMSNIILFKESGQNIIFISIYFTLHTNFTLTWSTS